MSDDRYGEGYLDALEHVQDLLVDENDWYLQSDGHKSKTTRVLHDISAKIDAWIDEWKESHAS